MILCKECYGMIEGTDWFLATMGRGRCDECGQEADKCFEVEDEE